MCVRSGFQIGGAVLVGKVPRYPVIGPAPPRRSSTILCSILGNAEVMSQHYQNIIFQHEVYEPISYEDNFKPMIGFENQQVMSQNTKCFLANTKRLLKPNERF